MKSIPKLGVATGVALLAIAFSPAKAEAQTHNQRLEKRQFKAHQKQERAIYGNSGALRQHQKGEKARFRAEERAERSGWYGGSGYLNGGHGYPGAGAYPNHQNYLGGWARPLTHNYPGPYHNRHWGGIFFRH